MRVQAKQLLAQLCDESVALDARLHHALPFFEEDPGWDAGVSVGLLPALVALLQLDSDYEHGFEPNWCTSATQWILTSLLHGPLRGNGFSGCNVARCRELFVEHDGAFAALMFAVEGVVARAVDAGTPAQLRVLGVPAGTINEAARAVLRFLTGSLMCVEAVGRPLALCFVEETAPLLRRLLRRTDLPQRAMRQLDPSGAVAGLVNQAAAIMHVWTERAGVCPGFLEALVLSPEQEYLYLTTAKSSAAAM